MPMKDLPRELTIKKKNKGNKKFEAAEGNSCKKRFKNVNKWDSGEDSVEHVPNPDFSFVFNHDWLGGRTDSDNDNHLLITS